MSDWQEDLITTEAAGTLDGVEVFDDGVRLAASDDFPQRGTWTSPEVAVPDAGLARGLTELLPSWNVSAPEETGIAFFVRGRVDGSWRHNPWAY